jgi:hypothetical protein
MHPGSGPGTSSRKCSMTPIYFAWLLDRSHGSHGAFPATCARPASRMHFHEAYYLCSFLQCSDVYVCVCVFSGLHLSKWKNHLPYVVDTINRNKPVFKSKLNMLIQYFTRPPVIVPQNQNNHYKYNIGDRVRLPLTKAQRNAIGFKWSLHRGEVPL